jgi:hypothetical protein
VERLEAETRRWQFGTKVLLKETPPSPSIRWSVLLVAGGRP